MTVFTRMPDICWTSSCSCIQTVAAQMSGCTDREKTRAMCVKTGNVWDGALAGGAGGEWRGRRERVRGGWRWRETKASDSNDDDDGGDLAVWVKIVLQLSTIRLQTTAAKAHCEPKQWKSISPCCTAEHSATMEFTKNLVEPTKRWSIAIQYFPDGGG